MSMPDGNSPTVVVTGANRGLGLEFCRQYLADGWRVIGVSRAPLPGEIAASVTSVRCDMSNEADLLKAASTLSASTIDVLINNAGVFGPKPQAEGDDRQSLGTVDADVWRAVMAVNALAPLLLTQALLGAIERSVTRTIAMISSVMGSNTEGEGGLYAYRASKAALNNSAVNLAKDVAPRGIKVALLCPGWVQTDMGGAGASLTPAQSVAGMRRLIGEASADNSGRWRRYNGDRLNW